MSTHKEGKRRVLSNFQPHARRQRSNATRLSHCQSRLQPARSRSFCFSCQMSSLCCSGLALQWRHRSVRFFLFLRSNTRTSCSRSSITFVPRVTSSSTNDDAVSAPKPPQLGYDPSEDLFGLEANSKPRNVSLGARKPRSWFGPNGQYIRELPCPSCRGRGYTPCSECGIERSRSDCSQCVGKGIMTCRQCSGECVIWEESIDERPWEKARSISPLRVKEDDEVDNLDIKLVKRKSKRVYQSPPPEVGLKISRSLKLDDCRV